MASDHVQRKLAAILAADVVGYSRLTGADEEGTASRLRALRAELIDPAIEVNRGRIVKTTGDGILIEFASVVDAVRCALEVQQGMAVRNAHMPTDQRIQFRVGINLGDVMVEPDGDLMGDGVNIAARLEGIAEPGGICLSRSAYEQVKGKIELTVQDRGEQRLKNIAEPVRVYKVDIGGTDVRSPRNRSGSRIITGAAMAIILLAVIGGGVWLMRGANAPPPAADAGKPAARLSIVVLPFANLSGDVSQDYLGDVLTEELTTSLSRLPDSFVVSRTTAFAYRGKAADVKQIGRELGVRYALEGSAQKSGKRVRVSAQLIDTETGAHLWADQFDADQTDLLEMQDEIVTRLARSLQIQLSAVEASRVARSHPENPDAEELALQCEAAYLRFGLQRKEMLPAFGLCERALQIDIHNVRALVILALRSVAAVINLSSTDPQADLRKGDEYTSRALAVDLNNYLALYGRALFLALQRPEEGMAEAERALALNPSFLPTYLALWTAYWMAGHPEQADVYADTALRLSPHDTLAYSFHREKGFGFFAQSRYEQATDLFKRAIAAYPGYPIGYMMLTASLALSGHDAEAHETLKHYLDLPGTSPKTLAQFKARSPFLRDFNDRVDQGLRKAGMPEE